MKDIIQYKSGKIILCVEMHIKNDEEENKKQTIDESVKQHGCDAGFHVEKIDWPMFSGKLEQ